MGGAKWNDIGKQELGEEVRRFSQTVIDSSAYWRESGTIDISQILKLHFCYFLKINVLFFQTSQNKSECSNKQLSIFFIHFLTYSSNIEKNYMYRYYNNLCFCNTFACKFNVKWIVREVDIKNCFLKNIRLRPLVKITINEKFLKI